MDVRKQAKQAEEQFWIARRDHFRARRRALGEFRSRPSHPNRSDRSRPPGAWFDVIVIVVTLALGITYAVLYGF